MALTRSRSAALLPWQEIADVQNRVRHLFDRPFLPMFAETVGWAPAVDISEDDGMLVVTAELPGMTREDVEIELHDNLLTISGEKKQEEEKKEGDMHVVERSWGSFQRSFTLPRPVDENEVKAEFRNGVLTVRLPKTATARGRKIDIAE